MSPAKSEFEPLAPSARGRLIYLSTAILLSIGVFAVFLHKPGMDWYERARTDRMIHGTAHQPFVHRALIPLVVRGAAACVPADVMRRMDRSLAGDPAIENLFTILGFDLDHVLEYLLALLLIYLSLWGFIWSLRYLFTGVYRASPGVLNVFTLVTLAGLTQFFRDGSYLYDLSNVFLFTLGLALLVRRRWGAYLFVYILACLNKETTILLAVVFALNYWRDQALSRGGFWALLTGQLLLSGSIKAALLYAFRGNPGTPVEWHLAEHNFELLAALPATAVFGWSGLILLLYYRWSEKPAFLRRALWIVPPLAVAAFLFGYLDQLRGYYEAYPIVVLLLLHSVSRLSRFELANRET